jgi:hypothetical protein
VQSLPRTACFERFTGDLGHFFEGGKFAALFELCDFRTQ